MVDRTTFRQGLQSLLGGGPLIDIQQKEEKLARERQARGLAGAALGRIPGIDQELAQVDAPAALEIFKAVGVAGTERQTQFKEDVRVAAGLAQTNPQAAVQSITQAIQRNEARGIPSPEMRQFLQDFQADPASGAQSLNDLNSVLSQSGPQERELRVKERGLELRGQEVEQRRLDREASLQLKREQADIRRLDAQLKRETNELKREQLRVQTDQKKRDVQFEATNAVDTVQNSIELIDRLTAGEGLESAAGISAAFPTLPGTQAADFEAQLETLKSQAFLTQVEKMKGLGALSENEGKKLGAAIGALDLSQSDKALRASLNRIKATLSEAKIKLQKKFNVEAGIQPQGPLGTATPGEGVSQGPLGTVTPGQAQQIGRFVVEVE